MAIAQTFVTELEREAVTTSEILSRVPTDKLDWRPHPKSSSLGQLAWHIATIPRNVSRLVSAGTFDLANARPGATRDHDDFPRALREAVEEAKDVILSIEAKDAFFSPFRLTRGEKVLVEFPTAGAIRAMMLNHWYHHRGQLTVYLRLLDIPLPVIYGSTADEQIG